MQGLIEKNKKWLKCYSAASRILGWLIILYVVILVLSLLAMGFEIGARRILQMTLGTMLEYIFNHLPVGIILLGVAQLLKYIYEDEYRPQWLLRNASKILYLFAGLAILCPFISHLYYHGMGTTQHVALIAAFSLILIGLGNILKRVMPIIEEHKSLI